jgi:hypothetical protein
VRNGHRDHDDSEAAYESVFNGRFLIAKRFLQPIALRARAASVALPNLV